jgi:hypothetical protein
MHPMNISTASKLEQLYFSVCTNAGCYTCEQPPQPTEAVYLRAHHVSLLNLTSRVCACNGMLFQSPTRGLRGKIDHARC